MDTPIDRAEHLEFAKRMEDEHKRINHRLTDLEETVRQIGELTTSVHRVWSSWLSPRTDRRAGWKNWKTGTVTHGARLSGTY